MDRWITHHFPFLKGIFVLYCESILQYKKLLFRSKRFTGIMVDDAPQITLRPQERGGFFQKIRSRKKTILLILLLALLGVGGYVFFVRKSVNNDAPVAPVAGTEKATTIQTGETKNTVNEQVPLFGDANYESENFRVGDVSIGGEAEFLLSEDSPEPLEVTAIRGESFTEKNKPEVKLVVNWRTNKLAKSEIFYSKGVGQAKKSIAEDDFSLNHSVIIPGLDQASTYVYEITSSDRFGNTITSESHAVYTGSRTVSLFDLIANAVGDVFGWAVKKN